MTHSFAEWYLPLRNDVLRVEVSAHFVDYASSSIFSTGDSRGKPNAKDMGCLGGQSLTEAVLHKLAYRLCLLRALGARWRLRGGTLTAGDHKADGENQYE